MGFSDPWFIKRKQTQTGSTTYPRSHRKDVARQRLESRLAVFFPPYYADAGSTDPTYNEKMGALSFLLRITGS